MKEEGKRWGLFKKRDKGMHIISHLAYAGDSWAKVRGNGMGQVDVHALTSK